MSRLSDVPVARRLAIGFGSTAVLLAVLSGISISSSQRLGDEVALVDTTGNLAQEALQLKFGAADLNGWQTAYSLDVNLASPNATSDDGASRAAFLTSAEDFRSHLETLATFELSPSQDTALETIRNQFEAFMSLDEQIIGSYRNGAPDAVAAANKLVLVDEIEIFTAMATAIENIVTESVAQADAEVAKARDDASNTTTIVLVGATLALLLALVLARVISRSITVPLLNLRDRLEDIADGDGDLTVRLDADRRDELGHVAVAFNKFVEKMAAAIRTISGHAMIIASSSEELSAVSKQLTGNAQETTTLAQRSSTTSSEVSYNVQTVASATEEMTSVISEIARSATEASNVAAQAMGMAGRAQEAVSRLGESSAQIDDVAHMISGIAEQTNLLALNATIEAARAGEAGKGFAVVATEVKDLATRSGGATADIARQVSLIQGDVRAAVGAIEEIVAVIDLINENQSTVAAAVQEQTATTDEISRSLVHVANGSGQITDDITVVARTAEEAAMGASDAAAAAVELSKLSIELQELVGQFKV